MKQLKLCILEKLRIGKNTKIELDSNITKYGKGDIEMWNFFDIKDSLPWNDHPAHEKIDYNKTNAWLEDIDLFKTNDIVYHIKDENLTLTNGERTTTTINFDLRHKKQLTQVQLNRYAYFQFYKNVNGLNIAILIYYDEHYKYKTDIYIKI